MAASAIGSFANSLADKSVPLKQTTAADAEQELAALIEMPAVGVPLPYEGVSLPDGVIVEPSPSDLEGAQTGVTPAGPGVGDYGSVVITGGSEGDEAVSLFAETHVAVVAASDVVQSMSEALDGLGPRVREGLTSAVIATGPSATADMGELVQGVHGPTSVHVVLVTDR